MKIQLSKQQKFDSDIKEGITARLEKVAITASSIYELRSEKKEIEEKIGFKLDKPIIKKISSLFFEKADKFDEKRIKKERLKNWDEKDAQSDTMRSLSKRQREEFDHLIDYMRDVGDEKEVFSEIKGVNDLRSLSRKIDTYFKKKAKNVDNEDGETEVVQKLTDGFAVVRLMDKQAYDREGKLMGHCVGSYWSEQKGRKSEILSLRDRNNNPHVTMETKKPGSDLITQLQGKGNEVVPEKYIPYIFEFLDIKL